MLLSGCLRHQVVEPPRVKLCTELCMLGDSVTTRDVQKADMGFCIRLTSLYINDIYGYKADTYAYATLIST
jgi:hypothetical protein